MLKLSSTEYLPSKENWFFALEDFDFDNLNVVILGQDPYHTKGVAHGLAFSSLATNTPPSLRNIFDCIKKDYPKTVFASNNLTNWKNQGVLLLNPILTVSPSKPLSHKNLGWETFSLNLLKTLVNQYSNIIFVILGKNSLDFLSSIDLKNQITLKTSHPSPFSAHLGFNDSHIFKKINQYLIKLNKKPIDWSTK